MNGRIFNSEYLLHPFKLNKENLPVQVPIKNIRRLSVKDADRPDKKTDLRK
jgi:hypothetical protein